MAHHSVESMRDRAFTKGRSAFDSDDEYRRALNGEFDDVREDFSYEANEDPDDGEDAGDLEDLTDEEAVKAELEGLEDRIGGTHFLEILEKFMKDCSGRDEPPYLPFPLIRDKEVLATFHSGSEALRLRYGAYGFAADRFEGDEVVKTWKGLSAVEALNDWDDALCELAEEAEVEKEDLEDRLKDEFFDDLPGILADRKRGVAFLEFVADASPAFADEKDGTAPDETHFPFSERFWLAWDRAECEFRLKGHPGEPRILATWDKEEFLEKLREVAWDDHEAADFMLGGGDVADAWEALDNAWYDEDDNGSVAESVEKFLAIVKGAKGDPLVGSVKKDVAVCDGMKLKLVWRDLVPEMAQLTVLDGGEEDTFDVPLAFLKWWAFGKDRGW